MKKNKIYSLLSAAVIASGIGMTSCSDWLDLSPIDYYGANNFWNTESQAIGNISAMMSQMRGFSWQINITYGELRGGAYTKATGGSDGASLNDLTLRTQNLSQTNYAVGNFGGYWKAISDINLFIKNVETADYFSSEKTKNYCLGMVYGMRAYYYFLMYRAYGGVPLRLTSEVAEGNYDPSKLYMPRSTASQTMKQIKDDLDSSLKYFGDDTSFEFNGYSSNAKYYWSKAATEMLAGEVYLWNAKVATGDQPIVKEDLAIAKKFFQNVEGNYNLLLQKNFSDIFDIQNKQNSEIIFAFKHDENESTNGLQIPFIYSIVTGYTKDKAFDIDGNIWKDPLLVSGGLQRYQYSNALWYHFDEEDTRRDVSLVSSWHDKNATQLRGTFVKKNLGSILESTGYRCFNGDQPIYRLPLVYLYLAEIANMENDQNNIKHYINLVRERAYGDNWDEAKYGYTPGTFVENEVAILHEKDKEFIQEGQRWYDVRRMSVDPACGDLDHLVFHNESSIVYGLDLAAHPNWKEASPNEWTVEPAPELKVEPLLTKENAYRVLWPLSTGDLSVDDNLEQTPGYEVNEDGNK